MRAFLLFLFLFSRLVWAQDGYQPPDVGIKFPDTIANMALVKITDYEKQTPGLGVGASYRANYEKADIYAYSGGLSNLTDGAGSIEVQKHFKEIVGEIVEMERQGRYQDVKIVGQPGKVEIGTQLFLHAELSYVQDNEPRISHVYLTILKGRFLKIRYIYFASKADEGIQTLNQLLKALETALTPKE